MSRESELGPPHDGPAPGGLPPWEELRTLELLRLRAQKQDLQNRIEALSSPDELSSAPYIHVVERKVVVERTIVQENAPSRKAVLISIACSVAASIIFTPLVAVWAWLSPYAITMFDRSQVALPLTLNIMVIIASIGLTFYRLKHPDLDRSYYYSRSYHCFSSTTKWG